MTQPQSRGTNHLDQVTISTPESVELTIELAGLGSRFIALMLDLLIMFVVFLVAAIVLSDAGSIGIAILAVFSFLLLFGYNVVFEIRNGGQTPGKKAASIKVIKDGGEPVTFTASAIRNILLVTVDLPFVGVPGMISVLVSKQNQRIGDLAAGTLVIRDRAARAGSSPLPPPPPPHPELLAGLESWDVSQINGDEIGVVRTFLQRRPTLDDASRKKLAADLSLALQNKVNAPTRSPDPEKFLEQLVAAKNFRS